MTRLWIAASIVIMGGLVGRWLVRRRRGQHQAAVTPRWLNENVYQKDGDSRWH